MERHFFFLNSVNKSVLVSVRYKLYKSDESEKKLEVRSTKSIRQTLNDIYVNLSPNHTLLDYDLTRAIVLDGKLHQIPKNVWDEKILLDYDCQTLHINYNKTCKDVSYNQEEMF